MRRSFKIANLAAAMFAAIILVLSCGKPDSSARGVTGLYSSDSSLAIPETKEADSLSYEEEALPETPLPEGPVFGPTLAPALPPVEPGIVEHGDRRRAVVAVTFDACEGKTPSGFDHEVWQILNEKAAKATVFLGGKWMETNPEETRMLSESPLIEIGNHSYIHPDFRKISAHRMEEEIKRTQDIQWALTGEQGTLFRFPFGTYNESALQAVAGTGLRAIQWDVVSGDPDYRVTARRMTRSVLTRSRPGSIIIFHINGRGQHTAEALPDIIDGLREKGLRLVTVSELMGYVPEAPAMSASRHAPLAGGRFFPEASCF